MGGGLGSGADPPARHVPGAAPRAAGAGARPAGDGGAVAAAGGADAGGAGAVGGPGGDDPARGPERDAAGADHGPEHLMIEVGNNPDSFGVLILHSTESGRFLP